MAKMNSAKLTSGSISRRAMLGAAAGGLALAATQGRYNRTAAQDKPTVTVGSKQFTEQEIVGQMLALLLENAGYEVERKLQLGGTLIVHEALLSGDVGAYVEYTGTGLITILGLSLPAATPGAGASPVADAAATPAAGGMVGVDAVYDIVKAEYQSQFNVVWLDPLGFNNTYTLAVRPGMATELGLQTISDLEAHAGDMTFGATQEFLTRPDGLPGMTAAYGFEFGDAVGMDEGIVYQALDSEEVDVISAFATDGRIPALGLVLLEDDLGFFPPYFAAPVVRQDLLDEDPAIANVLNAMAGMIDDQTMADLNFQVDDGGEEAEDVARTFLEGLGLIGS
ncbi:MAG: glycine betaine ABC transporter substrate-binding protein [Thermomicrobiales bacterium]